MNKYYLERINMKTNMSRFERVLRKMWENGAIAWLMVLGLLTIAYYGFYWLFYMLVAWGVR